MGDLTFQKAHFIDPTVPPATLQLVSCDPDDPGVLKPGLNAIGPCRTPKQNSKGDQVIRCLRGCTR